MSSSAEPLSILTGDILLALAMSRHDSDSAARAYLSRGVDWIDASSAQIPVHVKVDVLEGFAAAANRQAFSCCQANRPETAADFCRLACDWTRKLVALIDTAEAEMHAETEEVDAETAKTRAIWEECRAFLPKRLNMLSRVLSQGGSHQVSLLSSVLPVQS